MSDLPSHLLHKNLNGCLFLVAPLILTSEGWLRSEGEEVLGNLSSCPQENTSMSPDKGTMLGGSKMQ